MRESGSVDDTWRVVPIPHSHSYHKAGWMDTHLTTIRARAAARQRDGVPSFLPSNRALPNANKRAMAL